jgi:hypothetical protein
MKTYFQKSLGVFFTKFQASNYFLEFLIYFPIEKSVNRSTAAVDRVYGGLRARLTILLNRSRRFDYLWLGLEDRRGTNPLNLFR